MSELVQNSVKNLCRIQWRGLMVVALFMTISSFGQGKLLRGEKWEKFDMENTTADFYVATNGSDSWSGTLAIPNTDKSDGPFATIEKAQEAVRKLKATVF